MKVLQEKKLSQDKRELKKKNIALSKIMTPFVMILFVLFLLMVLNFHSLTHLLNRKSYEAVQSVVVEETKDPLAIIVPMVILRYDYQETTHEERAYFAIQPFFGLDSEEGTNLTIYVNKGAPNHFIFKENFFANWINWILLFCEGVFVSLLVRRIRRFVQNLKEKRKPGSIEVAASQENWQMERREKDGRD